MGEFKPEQLEDAKTIVNKIDTSEFSWFLLFGQPQMGKTARMLATAQNIHDKIGKKGVIPNFFIITGMNAKDYEDQITNDYTEYSCNFLGEEKDKFVYKNSDLNDTTKNKELLKIVKDETKKKYIFIDESHYGVKAKTNKTKDSVLTNFLKNRLNLDFSVSLNSQLKKLKLVLITVSATPFPELMAEYKDEELPEIIRLSTPENYYSIKTALEQDCVKDNSKSKDIFLKNGTINPDFIAAVKKAIKTFGNEEKGFNVLIRDKKLCNYEYMCKLIDCFKQYSPKHERIVSKGGTRTTLRHDPKDPKSEQIMEYHKLKKGELRFIVVEDMLRLAIRVNMENIRLIWDSTSDNVDTVVQSLIGRRCGYSCDKHFAIYTNLSAVEQYQGLIEGFQNSLNKKPKQLIKDIKDKVREMNSSTNSVSKKEYVYTGKLIKDDEAKDYKSKRTNSLKKQKNKENKARFIKDLETVHNADGGPCQISGLGGISKEDKNSEHFIYSIDTVEGLPEKLKYMLGKKILVERVKNKHKSKEVKTLFNN